MVDALDFTSKGDNDRVTVMLGGSKKVEIQKKYLTDVLVERELNEYGVYNSENDLNSNVKTGENEPNDTQAFLEKLRESVKNVVGTIAELKKTVEEHSKLSYDSLDICIAELETYTKSIEEESEKIGSANT